MEVLIVGAGIGGLTLGLMLNRAGIACRIRLPATAKVVLTNRKAPPDAILYEIYRRTGDKPFRSIDDVISRAELVVLSESYKRVAGYDKERLKANG